MFTHSLPVLFAALLATSACLAQTSPPRYLKYATHLGGSGSDSAFGVAADAAGNIFLAGYTGSSDFLATLGLGELELNGGLDAVVVKLDPEGAEVLAVATLGGPGRDAARGIHVTPDGDVYIFGEVTQGFVPPADACRAAVLGPIDVFVARLSNDLQVQSLHLLGGSGDDGPRGVHVSDDGVLSVLGYTTSTDLATTAGALQPRYQGGGTDFFVARLRLTDGLACADRVSYLTYLGSRGTEADPSLDGSPFPGAIVADVAGLVTVTGTTFDVSSFLTKPCSYRSSSLGDADGFVVQLNPALSGSDQLVYGAIVGGSAWDAPTAVELTPAGRIRVTGATYSGNFPRTTPPAPRGENDVFVFELDPRCELPPAEQLTYSTAFGGTSFDPPAPLVSLPDGSIVVGGISFSGNYPVTPDALGAFNGSGQAFLSVVSGPDADDSTSSPVRFSTPLSWGACGAWLECDRVLGLALLPDATVLACGVTGAGLLSVPETALQPSGAGGPDMFLCWLDLRSPTARIASDATSGTDPLNVCFEAADSTTPPGTTMEAYSWDFGDGTAAMGTQTCHEFSAGGVYTIRLQVANSLDLVGAAETTVTVGCQRGDVEPWISLDLGAVTFSGGARRGDGARGDGEDGCIALCAQGKTFSARADAIHFLHQEAAGDHHMTGRVTGLEFAIGGAAAGLMAREGLEPDARYAGVLIETNGRVRLRHRLTAGNLPMNVLGPVLRFPIELRLDREGDTFVSFAREASGQAPGDWIEVGRVTMEGFAPEALAGVATNAPARICDLQLVGPGAPDFHLGDANDDGQGDLSDAVFTLSYLFLGSPAPGCLAAANSNGDAAVDISDATYLRLLNETHKILLRGVRGAERQPGEVRCSQNWIGGTRPGNAAYVPPPPHALGEILGAFEKYLHTPDGLPPLIRTGLVHVHFETIHPYLDGNGRIGRLLITLLLEHWKLLTRPLLYLSLFFKRHRGEYYRLLNAARTDGDFEGWLRFFLKGVAVVADEAISATRDLFAIVTAGRARILSARSSSIASVRLFERLPEHPIVSFGSARRLLNTTKPTAAKAVGALVDLGILAEITRKKRDRAFSYLEYLDRLRTGTELDDRSG